MIYVLNRNKILSYLVSSFIVFALFSFSSSIITNEDIQLIKVSSNVIINDSTNNYLHNSDT